MAAKHTYFPLKVLAPFPVSTPMIIALATPVLQGPHLGWKVRLKYIADKKENKGFSDYFP